MSRAKFGASKIKMHLASLSNGFCCFPFWDVALVDADSLFLLLLLFVEVLCLVLVMLCSTNVLSSFVIILL